MTDNTCRNTFIKLTFSALVTMALINPTYAQSVAGVPEEPSPPSPPTNPAPGDPLCVFEVEGRGTIELPFACVSMPPLVVCPLFIEAWGANGIFFAQSCTQRFTGVSETVLFDPSPGMPVVVDPTGTLACGCLRPAGKGCLPPGTMITMSDRTKKPVEEIAVGDQVFNPVLNKAVTVKRIIESDEKEPLIRVAYGDHSIHVTQTHPLVTREGVRKANHLTLADEVRGADGEFHRLTELRLLPVEEGQQVINLVVDSGVLGPESDEKAHLFVADGFVVGDMLLQQVE